MNAAHDSMQIVAAEQVTVVHHVSSEGRFQALWPLSSSFKAMTTL
jgi:hypothetical protein